MTTKQHQISESAIQLFSEEGYHATSTSKVAKRAGVSEGLIFRHFTNKDGLLESIIREAKQSVNLFLIPIQDIEEPKETISNTLEIPFSIKEANLKHWKLLFKLKWELDNTAIEIFEPLKPSLINAFTKLRYRHPELETTHLIQQLNGLISTIILKDIDNKAEVRAFLFRKYHL